MSNAPPDLAEKVKAKVVGQVSEIADQVGNHMLIATSAVLLKNRDGLGGPGDMVRFVSHVPPGLKRPACQSSPYFGNSNGAPNPRRFARHLSSTPATCG
jgi:hypothetical protein